MTKADFIQMLRDAANFLESKPELPNPDSVYFTEKLELLYLGNCGTFRADTPEGVAQFARIVGGKLTKTGDDDFFGLRAERGNWFIEARSYNREKFCERVQVGTKIEPAHIVPARKEEIVPEREVPIYEWRCKPILATEPEPEAA